MKTPLKKASFLHRPVMKIVVSTFACLAITVLVKTFITKPFFLMVIPAEETAVNIAAYLSTLIFPGVYFLVFKIYDKRPITELSLRGWRELPLGLVYGIGVISAEFLVMWLTGGYKIIGLGEKSIFGSSLAILVVMAMIEEVVFRGIIYRIVEEWKGTVTALIISSILFQAAHFLNGTEAPFLGILLGVLLGLATGIMYTYTKRVWLPFAFHLGWNFAQLIFGCNLTGTDEFGTLLDAQLYGPEWLTGGEIGIEGSILSVLGMAGVFIFIYRKSANKGLIVRKQDRKLEPQVRFDD